MSANGNTAPVFLVAAPGTASEPLMNSLRIAVGSSGTVALVTAGGGEGPGQSVPRLADAFADAHFVFLAADETEVVPADVAALTAERWCQVDRPALFADPRAELRRVCEFAGIAYDQALLTPIEAAARAAQSEALDNSPYASASTGSFKQAVQESGGSLLISTYQTHRVVCVRAHEGELNTHFRTYDKPMGIAVGPSRLALGTLHEVWDFRDMPAAAEKLEPLGRHDACYLPRNRHVTGDIAVHDLGFASGELWVVATGFSCLATLDADYSFVPRWTPPFITRLAPEDRCHLNGMAIVDDRVTYVTALGTGDEAGSWRTGKATGGVVIDVASSQVAISGLSMPHSPRWHLGHLWLLESGKGTLSVADLQSGRVETVAELPGFTRGLTFIGDTAFVGLSQIRESSTFGDLPVTHRLQERQSGVWMVNVRSGAITGFLQFEDLVQEIFDVAFLPGKRWPEIAECNGETTGQSYVLPS
jgi:uncharacterized protein (TIGR03032 family)